MSTSRPKPIFMYGVGGTGMRGLAWLLQQQGNEVIGTDRTPASPPPGVAWLSEQDFMTRLAEADRLVHTDAIQTDHEVLQTARRHGLLTQTYHEALHALFAGHTLVAVAGTHGKSSTTAMLGHIAIQAGLDPIVLLGASVPAWQHANARMGASNLVIFEADEYRDHFLKFHPDHVIITTLDFDHPDYFASLDSVLSSFQTFLDQVAPAGTVVVPADVHATHGALRWPPHTVPVSIDENLPPLALPGIHMQQNASLAVALAEQLGVAPSVAYSALATFTGLTRRFERLGTHERCPVISDYGHHPAEIAATLTAARLHYPNQSVIVLLEPHMAARLQQFGPAFCKALHQAGAVVIAPVFEPAGRSRQPVDSAALVQELADCLSRASVPAFTVDSLDNLPAAMKQARGVVSQPDQPIYLAFSAGALDGYLRDLVRS